MENKIVVTKSTYDDIYERLGTALDMLGGLPLKEQSLVSIKINLCDARTPDTGAITHPLFLDALLRYIRENYGSLVTINVVESNATVALPDLFVRWFGFTPVLERWNANYVNLGRDQIIWKKGRFFNRIAVPRTISRSDYFISLAKLKTCSLTKITCALKNQFGCIPYERKVKYHRCLDDAIVEANLAMRPNLSIVDGIIAHVTTKGPAFGKPIPGNVTILGHDPVAVDSCCAKVLGFRPYFVGHIRKAAKAKVGNMRGNVTIQGFHKEPHIDSEFSLFEQHLGRIGNLFRKKR